MEYRFRCKKFDEVITVDDELLTEAQKISGISTKNDTVNTALREFILHHRQEDIIGETISDKRIDEVKKGNSEVFTLDQVAKSLGLKLF